MTAASVITFLCVIQGLRRDVAAVVVAVLLALVALIIIWGRDFYRARLLVRRRRWARALHYFERYQRRLSTARFDRLLSALQLSIYTNDGIALALNNIALCRMNLQDMPAAVQALQLALARDPGYAVPHANLAIIAALAGDATSAREELAEAARLGYSGQGAQLAVRRALASANTNLGKAFIQDTPEA
ncbi:MAG TPA: hypothetical protein VJV79_06330 [Polyangiaceae bacterium]|nr:hypothetical protein [Polyangiaceae bacterium]